MNIYKIESAIDVCKEHLDQTGAYGTEIESFLTRYLLVLISSCYEEELEKIFLERVNNCEDVFLIEFFKNDIPNRMKSVGISKLSEFISKFGNEYKQKFLIDISPTREATLYGNLIKNRHLVVHETQPIAMTFNEVINAYRESNIILDRVKDIISNNT